MKSTRLLLLAATFALAAPAARAQWIRGADTLSARAVADSQALLRSLSADAIKNPKDAALRHHIGMLAWTLSIRSEAKSPARGINGFALRGLADSSFRLAVQLDPKNARYELALGRFMRASSDPILRIAGPGHVDAAVDLSRTGPDSALHPAMVLESGHLHWLQYETFANHTLKHSCPDLSPSLDSASTNGIMATGNTQLALATLHNQLGECMRAPRDAGDAEYERAESRFREAYAALPDDPVAFRQFAMLLAEKGRWNEVASTARIRITRRPRDAQAWLAWGLALQRSAQSHVAAGVFDTATMWLDDRERARLFAFTRLLTANDSVVYAKADAAARTNREQAFWQMSDPLWSRKGNEPRTEFIARVAFAELRWTVEELGVRGADSDRGEIYIRYGPPDAILAMRGCDWADDPDYCRDVPLHGGATKAMRPQHSDVVTFWDYDMGLTVVFWGAVTYGTARIPVVDDAHVATAIDLRPASFDNVAAEKILAMPVRLARFRAPGDSIDLLAMTQVPMTAIRDATSNAAVRLDAWLLGKNDVDGYQDSTSLRGSGLASNVYRVAPAQYLYRVEATAPGTMIAGRAMQWITADRDTATGFALRGFGISDLLLVTAARANKAAPMRWRDFNVAPLLEPLRAGSNLDIIWETYDLGARGGQTQYAVALTLQRQRSASGRIAAEILGLVAGAVGIDRRDDRVTFKFDRTLPAAPNALVDHVTVAMRDTPAGDYVMTLEVTDKVSGRKAVSVTTLTIAK